MNLLPTLLVWAILMLALGVELLLAAIPAGRGFVPILGVASAVLVAMTFMRLASSRGLGPVFALASVFWLIVMLGMGSLDSFTRSDIPVIQAQVR